MGGRKLNWEKPYLSTFRVTPNYLRSKIAERTGFFFGFLNCEGDCLYWKRPPQTTPVAGWAEPRAGSQALPLDDVALSYPRNNNVWCNTCSSTSQQNIIFCEGGACLYVSNDVRMSHGLQPEAIHLPAASGIHLYSETGSDSR